VPMAVRQQWKRLVEGYLFAREELRLVVQLVDARHDAQKADIQLIQVLREAGVPFIVVATKSDRMKRSKRKAQMSRLAKGLGVPASRVILFSAPDKTGVEEVWKAMLDAAV